MKTNARTLFAALLTCALFAGCAGTTQPRRILPTPAYRSLATDLADIISHEMEAKELPSFAIALVDGQRIVWAQGFGQRSSEKRARARTVFRVGSVSKLFTDIAAMQLVEEGRLDLDAPVATYLPDFKPTNPFDEAITLRQLMSHRSGLVREPPIGNYFDPLEPSLADTVRSLDSTALVYPPTERTKYSNAAIAVVGRVVESVTGLQHPEAIEERILEPLGMSRSSFVKQPEIRRHLSQARMWSYDGREFEAPTFEFGMGPAANLYSTVIDQARFIRSLFPDADEPVLERETLEEMWRVQFEAEGAKRGFGLGFFVSELDGHRKVGHGGAVYGFSTSLAALPDEKIGVIAVSSRDVTNDVVSRIATHALRGMLAVRNKGDAPRWSYSRPLAKGEARKLAGAWSDGTRRVELNDAGDRLYLRNGWMSSEVRRDDDGLVVDGRTASRTRIAFEQRDEVEVLTVGGAEFRRVGSDEPAACPKRWLGLLGEYGWDHNTLFILEKDGQLYALIEWIFLYPLTEESETVFAFPKAGGLYHGEKLVFQRGASGVAQRVTAASVEFKRRASSTATRSTFRIEPVRPVDDLRTEALEATPPEEEGEFLATELVELRDLDESIRYDIRYATTNNFMGSRFYNEPRALLQRPAAEAVVRVHRKLGERGYGLIIHDAYRPWYVTKMFWDATPESQKTFVANPAKGSRHNRGCAVDVSLYRLDTGEVVEMPSGYDEFTERAFPLFPAGTSSQRWHRDLLRRAFESEGFDVYEWEWWHFDYQGWEKYRIHNLPFEDLAKKSDSDS